MTDSPPPQVAPLLAAYARDLARTVPSKHLDARIDALVAAPPKEFARPAPRHIGRYFRWAAAACFATLAVAAGVLIGVRLERAAAPPAARSATHEPSWPPPDFAMWPTDSVALEIPAEFSARGTLVAVDGKAPGDGTRYWVNIIVSNDGTIRIENIVPAGVEDAPSPAIQ